MSCRGSIYKLGTASCESRTKAAKEVHKLRWMLGRDFAYILRAYGYVDTAWPEPSTEAPCAKLVLFLLRAWHLVGSPSQFLSESGWRINAFLRMSLHSRGGMKGSGRLHGKGGSQ